MTINQLESAEFIFARWFGNRPNEELYPQYAKHWDQQFEIWFQGYKTGLELANTTIQ